MGDLRDALALSSDPDVCSKQHGARMLKQQLFQILSKQKQINIKQIMGE